MVILGPPLKCMPLHSPVLTSHSFKYCIYPPSPALFAYSFTETPVSGNHPLNL